MYRISIATLVLGFAGLVSCVRTSSSLVEGHCAGAQNGDAYCAANHADRPYCVLGTNACTDMPGLAPSADGCSVVQPANDCYSPCGMNQSALEESSCESSSSTTIGGMTDPNPTLSGPTSMDPDSTTIDPDPDTTLDATTLDQDCMDLGCPDPQAPFCGAEGQCVSCQDMVDPDASCESLDQGTPVCFEGNCVQCTDDNLGACAAEQPVCGAANVCEGCTEHAHCPDSACHLGGENVGQCFDADTVVEAASAVVFANAVNNLGANEDLVVRLTGNLYTLTNSMEITQSEVAIIGGNFPTINRQGNPVISVGNGALVYFGNVGIVNGGGSGLSCLGASMWLHDTEVRNNSELGLDVGTGCAVRLRRSLITANSGGGIDVSGGELFIENSVVGANGNPVATVGGIQLNNSTIEISYSTIAGNFSADNDRSSMFCIGGGSEGFVRNSIVVGSGGDTIAGCNALTWNTNAVDRGGLGGGNEDVGGFDNDWFQNANARDYRLTALGTMDIGDVAQWQDGDPQFDFDGNPVPLRDASYPGYVQPAP